MHDLEVGLELEMKYEIINDLVYHFKYYIVLFGLREEWQPYEPMQLAHICP